MEAASKHKAGPLNCLAAPSAPPVRLGEPISRLIGPLQRRHRGLATTDGGRFN